MISRYMTVQEFRNVKKQAHSLMMLWVILASFFLQVQSMFSLCPAFHRGLFVAMNHESIKRLLLMVLEVARGRVKAAGNRRRACRVTRSQNSEFELLAN